MSKIHKSPKAHSPATVVIAKRQAPSGSQEPGGDDDERDGKRPTRQPAQPPVTMTRIDVCTDPRVFAVLVDSCSRTCHAAAFIDHMRTGKPGASAAGRRGPTVQGCS